jgi:uncharacterized protein with HEPN domain
VSRADEQRIDDIIEAGSEIAAIVEAGRTAWGNDHVRQLAVERLLEIIGESARAMTDGGRARYPDIPWSDVIGLRTVLAHHYHRVDPDQVWTIATKDVPALLDRLGRRRSRDDASGPL